jgi:glycoside/pentoside/hexuronide:cation symporter, GPH family
MNGVMLFYFVARYQNATLTTMLSLIMMVGMFGASIFGKNLSDKFGKAKTCIGGLCLSIFGLLLRVVTGDATMFIMIFGIFCYSVGVALYMACLWPMIGDAIDYGELQSGLRPESMAFAGVTLISKIGEGISTALLGTALTFIGYEQNADVQTQGAVLGLQHLSSTVPLIFVIIMLIILLTNDMDKKHAEYEKELAAHRKATV